MPPYFLWVAQTFCLSWQWWTLLSCAHPTGHFFEVNELSQLAGGRDHYKIWMVVSMGVLNVDSYWNAKLCLPWCHEFLSSLEDIHCSRDEWVFSQYIISQACWGDLKLGSGNPLSHFWILTLFLANVEMLLSVTFLLSVPTLFLLFIPFFPLLMVFLL